MCRLQSRECSAAECQHRYCTALCTCVNVDYSPHIRDPVFTYFHSSRYVEPQELLHTCRSRPSGPQSASAGCCASHISTHVKVKAQPASAQISISPL